MSQASHDAQTEHPTADQELEQLAEQQADMAEERRRLQRGEVSLPWPYSTQSIGIIGIVALVTAGGLIALNTADGAFVLAGIAVGVAGVSQLTIARWLHRHFEIDPQPRYAPEGGRDE
jgi:hypothetical protein